MDFANVTLRSKTLKDSRDAINTTISINKYFREYFLLQNDAENQKIWIIDDISQHSININYTQSIILLVFVIILLLLYWQYNIIDCKVPIMSGAFIIPTVMAQSRIILANS